VHPTGIAVDIRRPPPGPCLNWVRGALAELEAKGIVEATEEHHPVHLHVAVLETPGARFSLPDLTHGVRVARVAPPAPAQPGSAVATSNGDVSAVARLAASPAAERHARTYVVRQGDALWDVAQRTGVSVKALAAANHRSTRSVLRPGMTLQVPEGGRGGGTTTEVHK
jgi:LysM repeat protein